MAVRKRTVVMTSTPTGISFPQTVDVAAVLATAALAILTLINCLGVRAGSTTQNIFMILKLLAIAALVAFGLTVSGGPTPVIARSTSSAPGVWNWLTAFGAALIPVQFAYGGWQTSCFVAGEVRDPTKNLPRGLLLGVVGVIAVYLSVNFVCVQALGPMGLAQTRTPATTTLFRLRRSWTLRQCTAASGNHQKT